MGELNPMLEYMPHTENGAPFTLSHTPYSTVSSLQEERSWNEGEQQSYYYPYFNDARDRGPNQNFAYTSPWYSTEDKMNQANYRFPTNYASLYHQSATVPWQNIVGVQNKLENVQTPLHQFFSDISSAKRGDKEGSTSRKLVHKMFERRKLYGKQNRHENDRSAKHRYYKVLARNFKKGSRRWKHVRLKNAHPYKNNHRKHSRIQRIFSFKSVRGKNRMHKKKHKLLNEGNKIISWRKYFNGKEKQRRNYEDIVNMLFDAFKTTHEKKYSTHHEHETRKDIYRHNLR